MKAAIKTVPLGEVVEIIGGGTPSKSNSTFFGGSIPWATVRDMGSDTLSATEHSITPEGLKASSSKLIPASEVIIASRVGLGKVCVLQQDTAINQDLRALIPKAGKSVDRRFLFYWFKSIASDVVDAGTGATVQGVKLPFLKELPFPVVPLEEQRRIVAILDEAFEGLSRARANAEANLRSARELFERQAGEILAWAASSKGAQVLTVAEIALARKGSIRTGPFGSQLLHGEFVDDGIAVLGIDNAVNNEFRWGKDRFITAEKYDQLRRYTVFPGDVIITIMGTCGRCAVIPDDIPTAINTKHLCCISLDQRKCLPAYLHRYFLLSPRAKEYLASQASGSIMDGLNMGIIKDMPVELPSLTVQADVVSRLSELEAKVQTLTTAYQSQIRQSDDLRQSLLQKAFAGELTVKEFA